MGALAQWIDTQLETIGGTGLLCPDCGAAIGPQSSCRKCKSVFVQRRARQGATRLLFGILLVGAYAVLLIGAGIIGSAAGGRTGLMWGVLIAISMGGFVLKQGWSTVVSSKPSPREILSSLATRYVRDDRYLPQFAGSVLAWMMTAEAESEIVRMQEAQLATPFTLWKVNLQSRGDIGKPGSVIKALLFMEAVNEALERQNESASSPRLLELAEDTEEQLELAKLMRASKGSSEVLDKIAGLVEDRAPHLARSLRGDNTAANPAAPADQKAPLSGR